MTYEEFIPFFADRTEDDDPVAVHMSKPKFVVSNTLKGRQRVEGLHIGAR